MVKVIKITGVDSDNLKNSFIEIKDLAKLMIKNPVLIENWTQLSDTLDSQPQDKARWKQNINNSNMKHYDVFCEMLQNWASAGGTTNQKCRIVKDLCHVFANEMDCVSLAEKLAHDFGELSIISTTAIKESDNTLKDDTTKENLFIPHELLHSAKRSEIRPLKKLLRMNKIKTPTRNFSGRQTELNKLKSLFMNSNENNVVLVCGIGGIGKTELCKKFADDICYHKLFGINIRRFRLICRLWLDGDNNEMLQSSLLKFGAEIGILNQKDLTPTEYFEFLASHILEQCTGLLVIIDNVDIAYEEVAKLIVTVQMTKYVGRMFVIVTSRNRMVIDGAGYTMKLEVLSKMQAIAMLKDSIDSLTNWDAEKLCELVQYFPLALQQAIAYIKEQRNYFRTSNYSITNYVEKFEHKKSEMLDHKLNKFEHDYSMTTLLTWDITLGKMSKNAITILKIIAFLEPEGIQLGLLEKICQKHGCDCQDLQLLHNYCLVKIENGIVSIHRLVQDVMRGKIENQEEYSKALFDSVFLVCGNFKKRQGSSRSELIHLNCICRFAWKCEIGYDIRCFYDAIQFLLQRDRIDCALKCIAFNFPRIQIHSDLNEVNKREWIVKVIWWGILYRDEYDSACIEKIARDIDLVTDRKSLEEGLTLCQKYIKDGCELNFKIKNRIAERFCFEGEFDTALNWCEGLLSCPFSEAQKKVYFETINYIMWKLDKIDGDRNNMLKKLLSIIEHFEEYNCKVVLVKIELADFNKITREIIVEQYGEIDYWRLPLRVLDRILPYYETILGKAHSLTVKIKNKIAGKLLHRKNEKERCIQFCKEVLYSPVDSEYEEAFHYLCKCKYNGNNDDLEIFLTALLKVKRLTLAESHSNIFILKVLLGKAMEKSGKLQEALELFQKIKDSAKSQYEWDQKDSQQNVMRVKLRIGDYSSFVTIEEIHREFGDLEDYTKLSLKQLYSVLTFYKSILGEKDKLTLKVINGLAGKLYTQRKYNDSLELLELVTNSRGDDDEINAAYNLMQEIGKQLFNKKYYKKAKELLERVLEFRITSLGEIHNETLHTKDVLAWVIKKHNPKYSTTRRLGL